MANPHGHDEAFSERPLGGGYSEAITEHPHGHAPHEGAPFSEAEIHQLHAQDLYAAKVVVTLMVSIFATGVVLYTIVAWACAS
jgi:hypothetical protein